ncbi:MAG: Na(+)/H(+) antiporter subunit B [Rickettsiales bacterium]
MKDQLVLRVVSKLILPFILLFGCYIQLHGDLSPGGGFQAGVILASAFILYGLIFGIHTAQQVFPKGAAVRLSALGLLLYTGTAAVTLLEGGELLNYSVLAHDAHHGQHWGIFTIELGVCTTVTSVMVLIYYTFGRYKIPASGNHTEDRG